MRRDHVGRLGPRPLRGGEQLRIEAELQNGPALGLAGELRVDDFVGPCPESRRRFDAEQHVCPSNPVAGAERALHDHVGSRLHRRAGLRNSLLRDADAVDDRDGEPARLQVLDVVRFVPAPPLLEDLLERVPGFRLRQRSVGDRDVERGQVPAMQMADEVGCAEEEGGGELLHGGWTLLSVLADRRSDREFETGMWAA